MATSTIDRERIYYKNQVGWTESDFNALHRYLSKMIEHAHDSTGSLNGEVRLEEIKGLKIEKMTEETKVLLYCSIISQNPQLLTECDNLEQLRVVSPLSRRLVLNPFKRTGSELYRKYNVLY